MADVIVEDDLAARMPDGTVLRATVHRPAKPAPAILCRTAYDRTFGPTSVAAIDPQRAIDRGYAVVIQDVRGRHSSDGAFEEFAAERADGAQSVRWVAEQPWCDGRVAMAGRSYGGLTQLAAATLAPTSLRAIAPVVSGCDPWDGWLYQGGAFQLGFNLFWISVMSGRSRGRKLDEAYRHLPLGTAGPLDDSPLGALYRRWLAHDTDGDVWRAESLRGRHAAIEVPALVVTGWYDVFVAGALENYRSVRAQGGRLARAGTRLIVGPWGHGSVYGRWPGTPLTGRKAGAFDLDAEQLAFFDEHLLGRSPRRPAARVRLFLTGADRWIDADDWPLPGASVQAWHLCGPGGAEGGGRLSLEPPTGDELPDVYRYDPGNPAPSLGGQTLLPGPMLGPIAGPLDQRPLEARSDVLVYSSDVLELPLEAVGPVHAVLYAATSATDMDVVAKLCDVDPAGPVRILTEGIVRARFRAGTGARAPVSPNVVEAYHVDLGAIGHVFHPGHRIRLFVTAASFPRFDRNPGAPIPPAEVQHADLRAADHTVRHDSAHPSRVMLTVVR